MRVQKTEGKIKELKERLYSDDESERDSKSI